MVRRRRPDGVPSAAADSVNALAVVSLLGIAALPFQSLDSATAASGPELVKDPASLVNPLIGTSGAVDTFPGPDMPFGMMQWGPDTTPDRALGRRLRVQQDSKISGYSLTHVSGPGCGVAGDVPILPVSGALSGNLSDTSAPFSHNDEQTGIGYYGVTDASGRQDRADRHHPRRPGQVHLPGRRAREPAAQAQQRRHAGGRHPGAGGQRPRGERLRRQRPLLRRGQPLHAALRHQVQPAVHGDRHLGRRHRSTRTPPRSSSAGRSRTLPRRGRPLPRPSSTSPCPGRRRRSTAARRASGSCTRAGPPRPAPTPPVTGANGMYLTFDTAADPSVTAAVGISYTSDANATLNLSTEVKGWNFDAMRRRTTRPGTRVLGQVRSAAAATTSRRSSTPRSTTRCCTPTSSPTTTASTWAWTTRSTSSAKGQKAQYANYSGLGHLPLADAAHGHGRAQGDQ